MRSKPLPKPLASTPRWPTLWNNFARALNAVERIGYDIGFNWRQQRWAPGEAPSDFASRLERWAQKVREHERYIRSPGSNY